MRCGESRVFSVGGWVGHPGGRRVDLFRLAAGSRVAGVTSYLICVACHAFLCRVLGADSTICQLVQSYTVYGSCVAKGNDPLERTFGERFKTCATLNGLTCYTASPSSCRHIDDVGEWGRTASMCLPLSRSDAITITNVITITKTHRSLAVLFSLSFSLVYSFSFLPFFSVPLMMLCDAIKSMPSIDATYGEWTSVWCDRSLM